MNAYTLSKSVGTDRMLEGLRQS